MQHPRIGWSRLLISVYVCMTVAPIVLLGQRTVPKIPDPAQRLRIIIDSDAACEIDDQYAISLALLSPERFEVEGIVGAHFGDAGGPDGIRRSVAEIQTVVDLMGKTGVFPVLEGAPPLQYGTAPTSSRGVDFIIDKALSATKEEPLWIVSLGPCTDIVSAFLKQPKIAEHVIVFWHGRTLWPEKCWNFNAYNDLRAVRRLFTSKLPLVLFDTGTYLRSSMDESEQNVAPYGAIGRYLHQIRFRDPTFQSPRKGFFDLGDVAALLDPSLVDSETTSAPGVDWDMSYQWQETWGQILRIYQIDRDRVFALLYEKLSQHYSRSGVPDAKNHEFQ